MARAGRYARLMASATRRLSRAALVPDHDPPHAAVRAIIGGVALSVLVLVELEQALNWASVIALLLVPVMFVAGTRVASVRPPGIRTLGVLLLAGLAVVLAGIIGTMGAGAGYTPSYWYNDETQGIGILAPWWEGSSQRAAALFDSSS